MSEEETGAVAADAPQAAPEVAAGEMAAEASAAPLEEPEEEANPLKEPTRQWVSLPGSSCNFRVGHGNTERLGKDLKSSVGKPAKAALIFGESCDANLVQDIYYQLTDAGFRVGKGTIAEGAEARTLGAAEALFGELSRLHITSDDLVLVLGDADQLSLALYVCGAWCAGTPVAAFPLDLEAAVCATVTPQGLSVDGHRGMVKGRNSLKNVFVDFAHMDLSDTECRRRAFATMVGTAVSDTQKAYEALYNRREELFAGDEVTMRDQLNESLRSRGRVVSSTSVAVRQSLEYGLPFAEALRNLVPAEVPDSTLLAEGLRFSARVAVTEQEFSVDDMLSQDELLESLGLGTVSCTLEPQAILDGMRQATFLRSNRFMLALPRSFGRVRLATVEDETLLQHLGAWCSQHESA